MPCGSYIEGVYLTDNYVNVYSKMSVFVGELERLTDGIFGFEARAFLKRLAKSLAEKWEKPYSTVRGFINARMSIALVRATNRCIRGSRIPASNMSNRFRWEGGAGLGLLKSDN